jgi:uncharacterized phage-associated protein
LVRGDLSSFFYPPKEIVDAIHRAFKIHGRYGIIGLRKSNTEFLSESDMKCLDDAIKTYGSLSFSQLTKLSHDKAWQAADQNDFMEIDYIIATFDNSKDLSEHLQDPHPGGI